MATTGKTGNKRKKTIANTVLNGMMVFFFLVCVGALFYPYIFDKLHEQDQQQTLVSYDNRVRGMDPDVKARLMIEAMQYNQRLLEAPIGFEPTGEQLEEYLGVLDDADDGIMGHLSIPSIGVELMIYQTVEEPVLQVGAGHMPGSSFPVGGKGTHAVLTGHTGLTTASLFTNLDRLQVGDRFYITVLEEVLGYEVDQILTVLPTELESLAIDPEQDYCTLITCTPYGINSHRLLVRGHRVETARADNGGDYGSYAIYTPVKRTGISIAEWMAMGGVVVVIGTAVFFIRKRVRKKKRNARRKQRPSAEEPEIAEEIQTDEALPEEIQPPEELPRRRGKHEAP